MYSILLAVVIIYLLCTAISGYLAIKQFKSSEITSATRIHRYRFSLVWNVLSIFAVFAVVQLTPITLSDIGFRLISLWDTHLLFCITILTLCCLLALLFLYQILAFLISRSYRKELAENLRQRAAGAKQYDQIVDSLIPRTSKEKQWFALTALAAGICEETVFRGFLFYLLIKVFPLSSISSAILVGLLFGTAHFYQGIKGIFKTALLGILFGFLFLVTNSLFPCILLHILFDLSSAFLYETVEK